MIVALPAKIPDTLPELLPMVAYVALLLVHVPPALPSVKFITELTHTLVAPEMATGRGLTVIVVKTEQPFGAM